MDMRTEGIETRKGTKPPGRRNADGSTNKPKPEVVQERLGEMVHLLGIAKTGAEAYDEAVVKLAEDSNYNTAELRKRIAAEYKGNVAETAAKIKQQLDLFENVGVVPRPQ